MFGVTLTGHGGPDCLVLREPGGTDVGEKIRALLLHEEALVQDPLLEALLFSASRRQLVLERIAPALAAGRHVLLDRSFLLAFRAVLSRPHHHRSSGAFSISAPQNRRQNEARI